MPYNTKQIKLAYKSKYNHKHKNRVISKSERIFDGEKWYNHPVTSLPRLLKGITSNH